MMKEKKKSIIADRERTDRYFEFVVKRLPPSITPNFITAVSIIPALIYLVLIRFSGIGHFSLFIRSIILILAFISIFFAAVLDGLDGALARRRKSQGRWTDSQGNLGNFLDHALDRVADVVLLIGIPLGGYCSWEIFSITAICMLSTSYLGALSEAIYGFREYGGILGRFRRLVILLLVTLISGIYLVISEIVGYPEEVVGFTFFGWTMIVFVVGGIITFLQRFYKIYKFGRNLIDKLDSR